MPDNWVRVLREEMTARAKKAEDHVRLLTAELAELTKVSQALLAQDLDSSTVVARQKIERLEAVLRVMREMIAAHWPCEGADSHDGLCDGDDCRPCAAIHQIDRALGKPEGKKVG